MLRISLRYGLCASILALPFSLTSAGCGTSATNCCGTAAPASSESEAGCCPSQGSHSQLAGPASEADSGASTELAKLPPDDRALAAKQKVCLVTGAPLGSMGVPTKVTVKGRTVFLCCGGCEKELSQNADKYLAQLDRTEAE